MRIEGHHISPAVIHLPATPAHEGDRLDAAQRARAPQGVTLPTAAPGQTPNANAASALPSGLPRAPFLAQYIAQEILPARTTPGAVTAYARQAQRTEAARAAAFDAFAWPETRLRIEA